MHRYVFLMTLGLTIWVVDTWLWILKDTDLGIFNFIGVGLVALGAILFAIAATSVSGSLTALGAIVWFMGNLAYVLRDADTALGFARFGEILFFVCITTAGLIASKGHFVERWAWAMLLLAALISAIAQIGFALAGQGGAEPSGMLGIGVTAFTGLLILALRATFYETKNASA